MASVEALIGAWLVLGVVPLTAWIVTTGLFALLAVVSLALVWAGESDCGCLGSLSVSPWVTFTFDVFCLATLYAARPGRVTANALIRSAVAAAAVGAAGFGIMSWADSERGLRWLASIEGAPAYLDWQFKDLGEGSPGDVRRVEAKLNNLSDRPLRVVGAKSSCSCLIADGVPTEVPPGGEAQVGLEIKFPPSPGRFTQTFGLVLDRDSFGTDVRGSLSGTVLRSPGGR